jgi:sulfite reductase (NADPH) flavoprotein alpha-component
MGKLMAAKCDREHPRAARLVARERLSGEGSRKNVYRLAFDIGDLDYACGDTLAVYPKNDGNEVDSILGALGFGGDENVEIRGAAHSIRGALIEKFCITHLPGRFFDAFVQKLAGRGRDVFSENFCGENEDQCSLLELLERFPGVKISCDELCKLLKKMPPRLYSIASSRSAHGSELRLIVGAVNCRNFLGNTRRGVASTYLTSRMQIGDCADVYIANSTFRLPQDAAVDVIMVGPGTGLAPFMGFLCEREYLKNTGHRIGRNWLFFGDHHRASDFLEEKELLRLQKAGVLNSMDLAFSRDQDYKIYVQDRMLERREELWEWMGNGASFYVCGDAKRMAVDVENMLKNVAISVGKVEPKEADNWLDDMKKIGRYQRDVY